MSNESLRIQNVAIGDSLPALPIDLTVALSMAAQECLRLNI